MTSDRGNGGGADMQFASLPVTPKSAGLNPNANVFHCKVPPNANATVFQCKVPPTPPESTSEWPLSPEEPDALTTLGTTSEALPYVNGDVSPSTPPKSTPPPISFPPTPESPPLTPVADFSTLNGGVSPPADPPANTTTVAVTSTVSNSTEHAEENGLPDNGIPHDQLKGMLKTQLEYYFSRENLASDTYLVSQMDADQYVAILTVANFNQVKKLTNSLDLVVEVLRESPNVQVDEKGERVRPLHKRCVVILREIPEVTPVEDIENLFSGVNCPRFISCEFAHNNNWYVTFPTDEDAQRAYQYLREEVRTFQGKPIMARIKAKPLLRSSFIPKNGFKQQYEQPAHTYTPPQRYAPFTPVPTTQYVISQQNYPFFPPSTVVQPWPANPMPFFDPGTVSTTLTPSAFAANGYTAAATYKMPATTGRHGYQSTRNRGPNKPHRGNHQDRDRDRDRDRMGSDSRMSHDRHMPNSAMSRSGGSRGGDSSHVSSRRDNTHGGSHPGSHHQGSLLGSHSSHSSSHNSSHVHPAHHSHPAHTASSSPVASAAGVGSTASSTTDTHHSHGSSSAAPPPPLMRPQEQASKDQTSQPQKKPAYRSRRRKDEDSSKPQRTPANSSSGSAAPKEPVKATGHTPKFDLEANAFPPLPGAGTSQSQPKASSQSGDIFENKMSDVVKGTAKAMTRDAKPTTPPSSVPPSSSTGSLSTTTAGVASVTAASVASTGKASPVPAATATASPTSSSVTTMTVSPVALVMCSTTGTSSCPSTEASPPLSPQKVSRATSTDKPDSSSASSSSSCPTAAQLQAQAKLQEESFPGAPKLSYAQMVQRTKDREARESAAAAAAAAAAATTGDKATRTEEVSASKDAPAAANGTTPTATKPQALREQPQTAMPRSSQRTPAEPARKDKDFKDDPRDGRLPRQLKENRERRDRFPRYRGERRREREPESSRPVTK